MTEEKPKKTRKFFKKVKVTKKQVLVGILLLLVVVGAIYVFSSWARAEFYVKPRVTRIKEIYSSLNLSSEYIQQSALVFGEKETYDWDITRSKSSEIQYVRGADVQTTVKDLDEKIKATGFSFIDEPYKGSAFVQYHYKSEKGEYIRLSVSSKLRDDAFQNFFLMNRNAKEYPEALLKSDVNAGPANVTIKVNLDDNNE